jgi:hypothetical protein
MSGIGDVFKDPPLNFKDLGAKMDDMEATIKAEIKARFEKVHFSIAPKRVSPSLNFLSGGVRSSVWPRRSSGYKPGVDRVLSMSYSVFCEKRLHSTDNINGV